MAGGGKCLRDCVCRIDKLQSFDCLSATAKGAKQSRKKIETTLINLISA